MRKISLRKSLPFLAILFLFLIFALCIFGVLLNGGEIYQNILTDQEEHYNENTLMQYLSARVHQGDWEKGVSVNEFDGTVALVLAEKIEDKVYETYIYCYDGWLWELYTEEGFAVSVSDGEKILPLKDFVAEFDTTQHMIKIRVQLVDEKWQDFNIYLHSGKEIGK